MVRGFRRVSDGRFRRTNFRLVVQNISSQTSWQVSKLGKYQKAPEQDFHYIRYYISLYLHIFLGYQLQIFRHFVYVFLSSASGAQESKKTQSASLLYPSLPPSITILASCVPCNIMVDSKVSSVTKCCSILTLCQSRTLIVVKHYVTFLLMLCMSGNIQTRLENDKLSK